MRGAAVCRLPLLALLGLWAMSPGQAAPKERLSQSEAALVQQALDRGTLIYRYDRAAWLGTDDLKARLPDFQSKVGGWIVDGPADSPQLVFYDKNEADPRMVYVADFDGDRLVSSWVLTEADDRSMTPGRKAMVAARRAALRPINAYKAMFCSEAMPNTVVLPPAAPNEPTLVYFLTPQSKPNSIPLGGHNLVEVSPDGKAGKPRPFTNSCMEMSFGVKGTEIPLVLAVTHLLDPVPTEIHVFSSLAAGLPIIVSTRSGKRKRMRIWETTGRAISLIDGKAAP